MSKPTPPPSEETQLPDDGARHRRPPPELRTSFETAEILRQAALRRSASPAQGGWRAATNSATGVRLRPGRREQREREALDALRLPSGRPRTIMVANPKGGAGKTPTSLMLAAVLGTAHNGYVLAWDNNETRGTLGLRAEGIDEEGASARDLLSALEHFADETTMGSLASFVRPQQSFYDVLPSDQDPGRMAQIGFEEFGLLHHVLSRSYHLIVVDTGNNVRAPNWQAAAQAADALVVVSNYDWDSAHSALWMLDHLRAQGREDLAARAVTVLSAPEPRVSRDARDELMLAFGGTAAIVEVPYDRELSGGGEINVAALRHRTRQAWMNVGAAVCGTFVDTDSPRVLARSIQLDAVSAFDLRDRKAADAAQPVLPPAAPVLPPAAPVLPPAAPAIPPAVPAIPPVVPAVKPVVPPAVPAVKPVVPPVPSAVPPAPVEPAGAAEPGGPARPAPVRLAGAVQLVHTSAPAQGQPPASAGPHSEDPPAEKRRRRLPGLGKGRKAAKSTAERSASPRSGPARAPRLVEPVGLLPPITPITPIRAAGVVAIQ